MKNNYTIVEQKELVTLRQRPTKGGGQSLYLDYMDGRKRVREFLKMYLIPERNKLDAYQNQETLKAATAAKAKRTLELQEGNLGIRRRRSGMLFAEFIDNEIKRYRENGQDSYAGVISYMGRYLKEYDKDIRLKDVDKKFILGFVDFMRGRIAPVTLHTYFDAIVVVLNNAIRKDLIDINPAMRLDRTERPKKVEGSREYLTLEEVKKLQGTPAKREDIKQAFLFACFTGLRISDIKALTWSNIKETDTGWRLESRQKKTGEQVFVPLSDNALNCLPKRRRSGLVWGNLPAACSISIVLRRWMNSAGIDKKITFHCSRHTFATLLISYGGDIYTTSKLLGHADIKTTEIYAKIVDKKKIETVNLIPKIG